MPVRLIFQPGKTVSWAEFSDFPAYSIALDGYCAGAPRSTEDGLRLNINHHEDVDRIATRSSCAQAFHLVKMGLFDTFAKAGRREATVYANDCDQDIVWATYVLRHPEQVDRPRLKHMVQLEDTLDMSAGLYPIKKRWHLLKRLLWVCEPYTDARADGSLHRLDGQGMAALVDVMHNRIRATLFGGGREVEPDTRFDVIAEFPQWSFIREVGPHARIGVAQKGIKAFVSLVASGPKRNRYVIVRRSRFISWFPLAEMLRRLNEAEGVPEGSCDGWGGGDNVIGSPRESGSKLKPQEVLAIVKEACAKGSERASAT